MRIEGKENFWQICHSDIHTIERFRSELVLRALSAQDIFYNNPVFMKEPIPMEDTWSYAK